MPSASRCGDNSTVAKMDFSGAADQTGTNYTYVPGVESSLNGLKNNYHTRLYQEYSLIIGLIGLAYEQRFIGMEQTLKLEATECNQWVEDVSST